MLEKDGEDQWDRSCEKRSIPQSQEGKKYPTCNEISKVKWTAYILRRNCLQKYFVEGRIEVAGRRGRRCKQLLNDLKETRRHWKMKE
jgi:hypothetical protein